MLWIIDVFDVLKYLLRVEQVVHIVVELRLQARVNFRRRAATPFPVNHRGWIDEPLMFFHRKRHQQDVCFAAFPVVLNE